jgi:ATP-dependent helicase HrpB
MVVEADRRGVWDDGCALAALLSADQRLGDGAERSEPSDLLLLLDSEWSLNARKVYQQLRRGRRVPASGQRDEDALLVSVLVGFPDRVARRRQGGELLLASGGAAVLASRSAVRAAEWLVAVDIEERRERGWPLVRLASAIKPEWLLDLFPERIREENTVEWNRAGERVETASALKYEGLVIEESRGGAPEPELAERLLGEKAVEAGIGRFADAAEVESFVARVAFAAEHSALDALGEEDVRQALLTLCRGLRSFAELEAAGQSGLVRALACRLPSGAERVLDRVAPEKIRLPGGRHVKVNYARGGPPWVASRLQDFFGMLETPRVAEGKVSLVVHLLAPNNRPVQTTTDLAGFWERLYPELRRQLSRRYPRHKWPERAP